MPGDALRLVGRPLCVAAGGGLALGEPVCVHLEGGRVAAITAASEAGHDQVVGEAERPFGPALTDLHTHLLAAASARTSLDLSRHPPADLRSLFARVRAHAGMVPEGAWVRVRGFDESHLAEARAPTADELDAALPGRLIRLRHATLHASILSRAGLARLGWNLEADESRSGWVQGRETALSERCGRASPAALEAALAAVGAELRAGGIASVDDITASNDARRVGILADAVERGDLPQRVRVWLRDAEEEAAARAAARGRVEIAGVKLLAMDADEAGTDRFGEALARARRAGLPVAIHAVEPDVIDAALQALTAAPPRALGAFASPDRLEHCSLCPPELAQRIAAAGVAVVTQPGFLVARGGKYRREVESPLWDWLYPLASLLRAGVLVAAGSDMPVAPPDPRLAFQGATTRDAGDGVVLGPGETVSEAVALDLCTRAAARVRGEPGVDRPWLRVGARADFALLEEDPIRSGLASWKARELVIGGRPVGGVDP